MHLRLRVGAEADLDCTTAYTGCGKAVWAGPPSRYAAGQSDTVVAAETVYVILTGIVTSASSEQTFQRWWNVQRGPAPSWILWYVEGGAHGVPAQMPEKEILLVILYRAGAGSRFAARCHQEQDFGCVVLYDGCGGCAVLCGHGGRGFANLPILVLEIWENGFSGLSLRIAMLGGVLDPIISIRFFRLPVLPVLLCEALSACGGMGGTANIVLCLALLFAT